MYVDVLQMTNLVLLADEGSAAAGIQAQLVQAAGNATGLCHPLPLLLLPQLRHACTHTSSIFISNKYFPSLPSTEN